GGVVERVAEIALGHRHGAAGGQIVDLFENGNALALFDLLQVQRQVLGVVAGKGTLGFIQLPDCVCKVVVACVGDGVSRVIVGFGYFGGYAVHDLVHHLDLGLGLGGVAVILVLVGLDL